MLKKGKYCNIYIQQRVFELWIASCPIVISFCCLLTDVHSIFLAHVLRWSIVLRMRVCIFVLEHLNTYSLNLVHELTKVPTLMSLINVELRLFFLRKYSRPYAVIPDPTFIYFWKKSLKIWVKIETSGYFQQFLCLILQKFHTLR